MPKTYEKTKKTFSFNWGSNPLGADGPHAHLHLVHHQFVAQSFPNHLRHDEACKSLHIKTALGRPTGRRGARCAELATKLTIPMTMPLQKSDTEDSSTTTTKRAIAVSWGMT